MTIHEAHETITLHKSLWGKVKTELVEMALLDLTARIQKKKTETDVYPEPINQSSLLQKSQAYFAVI